ncbi:tape measure protein [Zhongshania sp.]|uniref:tape measure protein n=1 Tax=Zhongshania sp. TaxID=1971902 RepID=UPI0035689E68
MSNQVGVDIKMTDNADDVIDRIEGRFDRLEQKVDDFASSTNKSFERMRSSTSSSSTSMVEKLKEKFSSIKKFVSNVFDGVKNIINEAFKAIIAGGATAVAMGRGLFELSNSFIAIRNALAAASLNAAEFKDNFEFLQREGERLGQNVRTLADNYTKLLIASRANNLSLDETRMLFSSVAEAARGLRLSTEDTDLAFRAIVQIMSKGKLQAEELRRQFAERVPGGFQIAEKALGYMVGELDKALERGEVTAEVFGKKIPTALRDQYAQAAVLASRTADAEINRTMNTIEEFARQIGEQLDPIIAVAARKVNQFIKETQRFVTPQLIADLVTVGAQTAANIATTFFTALQSLVGVLKTIPQIVQDAVVTVQSFPSPLSLVKGMLTGEFAERFSNRAERRQLAQNLVHTFLPEEGDVAVVTQAQLLKIQSIVASKINQLGVEGVFNPMDPSITGTQRAELENNLALLERIKSLVADQSLFAGASEGVQAATQLTEQSLTSINAILEAGTRAMREFVTESQAAREQGLTATGNAGDIAGVGVGGEVEQKKALWERILEAQQDFNQKQIDYAEITQAELDRIEKMGIMGRAGIIKNALGGMLGAMAGHSKKAFELNKKLNIAQAVIDGIAAAVGAFKVGSQIGGPVLGAAFAAASVATTGAMIKNIKSQQYGGGGGSSSSVPTSSAPASAAQTAPATPATERPQNTVTERRVRVEDSLEANGTVNVFQFPMPDPEEQPFVSTKWVRALGDRMVETGVMRVESAQ